MTRFIDRSSVPPFIKGAAKQGLALYRILTSPIRLMPDFVIIGAQRCGTTFLYSYLVKYQRVARAFKKEVHFFDINFRRGMAWYRAYFPPLVYKYYVERIRKQGFVTGEASPYYIFHPHAPRRILGIVPRVKLIVLLRNPVDRAYSHYHHEVRMGIETSSFEDAIESEEERLRGEIEKILEDENYYSFNHQHYSYLSRGVYVDQLKVWMSLFPEEQVLILRSEDLYDNPPAVLKQVMRFLSLPSWELGDYGKYSSAYYPEMDATTRKHLVDYFRLHNQRLYEYLEKDFRWDT